MRKLALVLILSAVCLSSVEVRAEEDYVKNRKEGSVRTGEKVYFERGAMGIVGGWIQEPDENLIVVGLQADDKPKIKPKNTYLEICAARSNVSAISINKSIDLDSINKSIDLDAGDCFTIAMDKKNPATNPFTLSQENAEDKLTLAVKEI